MAVEVYYWFGAPGHVAIKVDGGSPPGTMYLSRWPRNLRTVLVMGFEGAGNSYSEDVAAEGGPPHVVRFTRLDETAVKKAIKAANEFMVYNDFQANCSTHVRFCLDAGITGGGRVVAAATHGGAFGWLAEDTPFGVYGYASALHSAYA